MAAGSLCLFVAFLLTGYNIWDGIRAGKAADQVLEQLYIPQKEGSEAAGEIPDYILDPDREMPEAEIDGQSCIGILEIPCLGLSLPVISQWSEEALKISPCRYSGSPYKNDFVIAGHNYSRHFSGIKRMSGGEEIKFTDMDGNVFSYEVSDLQVLKPDETEAMINSGWDLTLFTCSYGGRDRVAVRCSLVPD